MINSENSNTKRHMISRLGNKFEKICLNIPRLGNKFQNHVGRKNTALAENLDAILEIYGPKKGGY